jgi:hypothetical protein
MTHKRKSYGVSLKRIFGGHTFHYHSGRHNKVDARRNALIQKGLGYKTRIIKTTNEGYVVYIRG